jgi:wyosine [tRNA(Phe)-imidazoG37] synthetase (radical SAM superfamily)
MPRIHDFTVKLQQPALAPQLSAYLEWRRAIARARMRGEPDPSPPDLAPISINLDLTTACNYRCTHCIDWDILNTRHRFDEEELHESLRRMAERGLRSVILIGGGEPTLFPRFVPFVAFLKSIGLQVAVVTNGSRGQALAEAAVHMNARDWIRLSLDAGSNELFARMHRPASRTLDLDEICEWVPQIKRANPAVRVGYSYIIVWEGASREEHTILENVHEIAMAARRAREAEFDYIAYKPVLERRPSGAEVMDPSKARAEIERIVARIRAELIAARRLADEHFRVYESTNLRALEDGSWTERSKQPRTCHMQALRQVLTPRGLYNCPAHRGVPKARIAGPGAYANDLAAAETGGALLRILDDFDASHECREVTCLYNEVNWLLEKVLQEPTPDLDAEVGDEREDYFL